MNLEIINNFKNNLISKNILSVENFMILQTLNLISEGNINNFFNIVYPDGWTYKIDEEKGIIFIIDNKGNTRIKINCDLNKNETNRMEVIKIYKVCYINVSGTGNREEQYFGTEGENPIMFHSFGSYKDDPIYPQDVKAFNRVQKISEEWLKTNNAPYNIHKHWEHYYETKDSQKQK